MAIQLKPETERLVQEKLASGEFQSVDEIIVQGIEAGRGKRQTQRPDAERQRAVARALDFARNRAVPLDGLSIKQLLHEGHRV